MLGVHLERVGFCEKWIQWNRCCLESVSVSVLVNGGLTKEFSPMRGLCQGDLLPPFLFLIATEGLTGVSRMVVEKNLIDSLEIENKKVKVNLLQYTNDTLFFWESNTKSFLTSRRI